MKNLRMMRMVMMKGIPGNERDPKSRFKENNE